jgi:four helix bundle protein
MKHVEWLKSMPKAITDDSVWRITAYRLALFLGDVAWLDTARLAQSRQTIGLASQLYEAVGSINANLAEGYSRGTGRDRAGFDEYALGSAREARDWYFKARHVLGESVCLHCLDFLAEIIRLLLAMVPDQRGAVLKEEEVPYRTAQTPEIERQQASAADELLNHVPLPGE